MLDNGILSYGKSASEVNRGRTHGRIDVGQAVISAKTELFRIDIDDEAFLHHLKVRKCSEICSDCCELSTFLLFFRQVM